MKFSNSEEFLAELRDNPRFRREFARNPGRLLEAIEAPADVKARMSELASVAGTLLAPVSFPGIFLQVQGQERVPVLQQGGQDEAGDGQEPKVVFTKGRTFHSITRRDCTFQVVLRKSEREHRVTVDNLNVEYESSRDVTQSTQVITQFQQMMKGELTTELKATLEGYGLSATQVASMTYQQIETWIQNLVVTQTVIVTVFEIRVTGQITSQEVWKTEEHWNWVGNDCGDLVLDEPEVIHSETSGPPVTYDIDSIIIVREVHSPSVRTQGIKWAEEEAGEIVDRLIDGRAFLPEPPPASGIPSPPNIP